VKQVEREIAVSRPVSSIESLNREKMVGLESAIRQFVDLRCCQPRRGILCGLLG